MAQKRISFNPDTVKDRTLDEFKKLHKSFCAVDYLSAEERYKQIKKEIADAAKK